MMADKSERERIRLARLHRTCGPARKCEVCGALTSRFGAHSYIAPPLARRRLFVGENASSRQRGGDDRRSSRDDFRPQAKRKS
jgi:hypothetical protein